MKVVIWNLPEKEIAYLKRNCQKQFEAGEICVLDTTVLATEFFAEENSDTYNFVAQIMKKAGICSKDELLVISANASFLIEVVEAGIAAIAYQAPHVLADEVVQSEDTDAEQFGESNMPNDDDKLRPATFDTVSIPPVDMLVEGFEEVGYTFLEQVYNRHYGIPWTILETDRLVVRELSLGDMDALFELYSYEGMTDYMEGLYPYEEEYAYQKAYIENMYRFFGYGMWLVFEKESGKMVGRAGVEHREELEGELELGYAIGTPWQKKGYGTEVCSAILEYVREELGFMEMCSLVQPENTASIKLLEKLGFFEEKETEIQNVWYKKYKKIF